MSITLTIDQLAAMKPKDFRQLCRQGKYTGSSLDVCNGYARAGLTIVPKEFAFDFFLFCHRNPRALPLNDVTDPGSPHPMRLAPNADLRTDLPSYNVFVNGKLEKGVTDITDYWRDDLVAFLTGCSRGFDAVLTANNINYRYFCSFATNIRCIPAGRFQGPLGVSCRLVKGGDDVVRTIQIASRYPAYHGPPVHVGDPAIIGIKDLCHPDVATSTSEAIAPQEPDEIAMFWGCGGSTLKLAAMESKLPLMITEGPAALFVTDRLVEDLAILS